MPDEHPTTTEDVSVHTIYICDYCDAVGLDAIKHDRPCICDDSRVRSIHVVVASVVLGLIELLARLCDVVEINTSRIYGGASTDMIKADLSNLRGAVAVWTEGYGGDVAPDDPDPDWARDSGHWAHEAYRG